MATKHALAGEGPSCPCCIERLSQKPGGFTTFRVTPSFACEVCLEPVKASALDLPPFDWPTTAAAIEASAEAVLAAAAANLDAVAAVPDAEVSFANVIRPLMLAPNYKTNHLVCQSKFQQHCSTDEAVRTAAEEAGKKFAAFKAAAKTRADVYAKVEAFAATAAAAALPAYEARFRARSHCRFVRLLIHFIPGSLRNVFGTSLSERPCDRTPGALRGRAAEGLHAGRARALRGRPRRAAAPAGRGRGVLRVISDCRFRKTITGSVRKFGIKRSSRTIE
jgi:hypothetical protein